MSLIRDQQHLRCDGDGPNGSGCDTTTPVPVGLQRKLTSPVGGDRRAETPARDWLFVGSSGGVRHYCPHCAARYLFNLRSPSAAARRALDGEEA